MTPTTVDCYFDYVSPFSYLLHEQLYRLPPDTTVNYIPVLFAGLLKHWGNLGPVEIERKKTFTYRHATWLAKELNVPFRVPDTHPFIPLPFLRVTIAKNNDPALISAIYRAIWTTNNNPTTEEGRKDIWNTPVLKTLMPLPATRKSNKSSLTTHSKLLKQAYSVFQL